MATVKGREKAKKQLLTDAWEQHVDNVIINGCPTCDEKYLDIYNCNRVEIIPIEDYMKEHYA
jgi:hypothetical protein